MRKLMIFVLAATWLPLAARAQTSGPPEAGETLGVWCDVVGSFVSSMTISADENGRISLRRTFTSGNPLVQRMRHSNGTYWVIDSSSGDRYRVVTNGDLQLIDNDGPIRTARRVRTARECSSR
jgi:hypothetical protein